MGTRRLPRPRLSRLSVPRTNEAGHSGAGYHRATDSTQLRTVFISDGAKSDLTNVLGCLMDNTVLGRVPHLCLWTTTTDSRKIIYGCTSQGSSGDRQREGLSSQPQHRCLHPRAAQRPGGPRQKQRRYPARCHFECFHRPALARSIFEVEVPAECHWICSFSRSRLHHPLLPAARPHRRERGRT